MSAGKAPPWVAEHLSGGQLSGTEPQWAPLGNPPDNPPGHLPRGVSSHPTRCHALWTDDPRYVSLALTCDPFITWPLGVFLRASRGLQGRCRCPWLGAFPRAAHRWQVALGFVPTPRAIAGFLIGPPRAV